YVAPTLRLSLRAITLVFTFSRASAFIMRTSSLVHRRSLVVFFAISAPSSSHESATIVSQKAPLGAGSKFFQSQQDFAEGAGRSAADGLSGPLTLVGHVNSCLKRSGSSWE